MPQGHAYDQSAVYQIRVRGILNSSWSDWFDVFTITQQNSESILEGYVTDQAALHGILAKIHDLGLSLISVSRLPQEEFGDQS